jgi:hypothetical protein
VDSLQNERESSEAIIEKVRQETVDSIELECNSVTNSVHGVEGCLEECQSFPDLSQKQKEWMSKSQTFTRQERSIFCRNMGVGAGAICLASLLDIQPRGQPSTMRVDPGHTDQARDKISLYHDQFSSKESQLMVINCGVASETRSPGLVISWPIFPLSIHPELASLSLRTLRRSFGSTSKRHHKAWIHRQAVVMLR